MNNAKKNAETFHGPGQRLGNPVAHRPHTFHIPRENASLLPQAIAHESARMCVHVCMSMSAVLSGGSCKIRRGVIVSNSLTRR